MGRPVRNSAKLRASAASFEPQSLSNVASLAFVAPAPSKAAVEMKRKVAAAIRKPKLASKIAARKVGGVRRPIVTSHKRSSPLIASTKTPFLTMQGQSDDDSMVQNTSGEKAKLAQLGRQAAVGARANRAKKGAGRAPPKFSKMIVQQPMKRR